MTAELEPEMAGIGLVLHCAGNAGLHTGKAPILVRCIDSLHTNASRVRCEFDKSRSAHASELNPAEHQYGTGLLREIHSFSASVSGIGGRRPFSLQVVRSIHSMCDFQSSPRSRS